MSFIQTHTHAEGRLTERQSARKAERGAIPIKKRILARLKDEPRGITPDEFCEETGGLINTIRRRFTDLWKEGKIRHHPQGRTRLNRDKNECVVWVLGEDVSRKPSRHEELKAEVARLRGLLVAYGIEPDQADLFASDAGEALPPPSCSRH